MFLTWTLWKAIQTPPRQQIVYRYVRKLNAHDSKSSVSMRIGIVIAVLSVVTIGLLNPSAVLGFMLATVAAIPVFLLVFNSTIQGLYWLTDASRQIGNVHRKHQYDLIYLTPGSALGIVWMLAVGCLHKTDSFRRLGRILKAVVIIVIGMIGIFGLFAVWNVVFQTNAAAQLLSFEVISSLIYIGFFMIGMWLDYVQSITTSLLLAILGPTYTRDEFILSNGLPVAFLALQVLVYLGTAIVFVVFQTILIGIFGTNLGVVVVLCCTTLLSYYFLRETSISGIWRVIQTRYDAQSDILLDV